MLADFLGGGGRPEGDVDPAVLGAFLTDAHRERLTAALLRTSHVTAADLDLYTQVSPWHDDALLPWLIDQLATVELSDGTGRRMMAMIAEALGDDGLAELQQAGDEQIQQLEQKLYDASRDAARQRLGAQIAKAEQELRSNFVEALAQRDRR